MNVCLFVHPYGKGDIAIQDVLVCRFLFNIKSAGLRFSGADGHNEGQSSDFASQLLSELVGDKSNVKLHKKESIGPLFHFSMGRGHLVECWIPLAGEKAKKQAESARFFG